MKNPTTTQVILRSLAFVNQRFSNWNESHNLFWSDLCTVLSTHSASNNAQGIAQTKKKKHSNLHWIDSLQFPWLTASTSLVSERIALSTEPQPLPKRFVSFHLQICTIWTIYKGFHYLPRQADALISQIKIILESLDKFAVVLPEYNFSCNVLLLS